MYENPEGRSTAPLPPAADTHDLSLSGAPSLALLLPFLTSGPNLGAWPDCWVSVEFLHALILRKRSGSTTTTKMGVEPR